MIVNVYSIQKLKYVYVSFTYFNFNKAK